MDWQTDVMDRLMDGQMDGWMDESKDRQIDGQMDGWMEQMETCCRKQKK